MIKNANSKLYIGISKNPEERIQYHNTKQGALFTKTKDEFAIVFSEKYETLVEARKREVQIKKWRREKKEMLIKRYQTGLQTRNN